MAQLKYWDGSAWVNAVIGAQGAQGPTGPVGATGATGPSALTTKGDLATYSTTIEAQGGNSRRSQTSYFLNIRFGGINAFSHPGTATHTGNKRVRRVRFY